MSSYDNLNMDKEDADILAFSQEYNESSDIKKVSLVIENLKSQNHPIRLLCAKKFLDIGKILGPQRIEEELIPYIADLILNSEDNEEVLTEFALQLLELIKYLQENKIFSGIGLRSLEILAGNDDETVRQTAVDGLLYIIQHMEGDLIINEIFPLIRRLIDNDIKNKMSVCYLLPVVYPKLQNDQIKKEILQVFYDKGIEDAPSVRRAAADNIKHFCAIIDDDIKVEILKLYDLFLKDPIDIVKITAIEATKSILDVLPENEKERLIMDFLSILPKEKSWRVKYSASECISVICKDFSKTFNENKFCPILMLFLKDIEPEVKCSVLAHFDSIMDHLEITAFTTNFLSIFKQLADDQNLHVRSVYASCILKNLKHFKQDDNLMINSIMPLLTKLLKDNDYEVQYSAVQNIDELIILANSNKELYEKCVKPILEEGMENKKWRFRLFIAENLLKIVSKVPYDKLFEYNYFIILQKLFSDHAQEIRDVSWKIIKEINQKLNNQFIESKIWPIQEQKLSSNNYLMRMSSINSITFLKEFYNKNKLKDDIAKAIMKTGNKDKVPNVKFCSCIALKDIALFLNNYSFTKDVKEYINKFTNDDDVDVVEFAKKALNELQ